MMEMEQILTHKGGKRCSLAYAVDRDGERTRLVAKLYRPGRGLRGSWIWTARTSHSQHAMHCKNGTKKEKEEKSRDDHLYGDKRSKTVGNCVSLLRKAKRTFTKAFS